jgi:hypothetical protein
MWPNIKEEINTKILAEFGTLYPDDAMNEFFVMMQQRVEQELNDEFRNKYPVLNNPSTFFHSSSSSAADNQSRKRLHQEINERDADIE